MPIHAFISSEETVSLFEPRRYPHPLVKQELLEGGEPALVVTRSRGLVRTCYQFRLIRSGDFCNQAVTEFILPIESLLTQGNRQSKDSPFPPIMEDKLSALAGQSGCSTHFGDARISTTRHNHFLPVWSRFRSKAKT